MSQSNLSRDPSVPPPSKKQRNDVSGPVSKGSTFSYSTAVFLNKDVLGIIFKNLTIKEYFVLKILNKYFNDFNYNNKQNYLLKKMIKNEIKYFD